MMIATDYRPYRELSEDHLHMILSSLKERGFVILHDPDHVAGIVNVCERCLWPVDVVARPGTDVSLPHYVLSAGDPVDVSPDNLLVDNLTSV